MCKHVQGVCIFISVVCLENCLNCKVLNLNDVNSFLSPLLKEGEKREKAKNRHLSSLWLVSVKKSPPPPFRAITFSLLFLERENIDHSFLSLEIERDNDRVKNKGGCLFGADQQEEREKAAINFLSSLPLFEEEREKS